jgi:hypothetical protein
MGELEDNLTQRLSSVGTLTDSTLRFPKAENVAASGLKTEIERVYRSLGGAFRQFLSTCAPGISNGTEWQSNSTNAFTSTAIAA